jgi:tryptophanyl-tRNA synthetase
MADHKKRIFSGIQPTGGLHIGNYYGAIQHWVGLVESGRFDALFCIVDAHAVTVDYDVHQMPKRIFEAALTYVACGLDPERCTVFVQSDVPEHMELAWYLGTVTPMGELNRMTQFKEKSDEHKQNVNAGLFVYPILMAADILLYKGEIVPVGDDQVQHLELAREIARRFNARFGSIFPEPQPKLSPTPRIMGLDGKTKMSKTRGNAIDIFEEPKALEKKLKGAFTDPQKLKLGDPGHPEICNIFTIHKAATPAEQVVEIERDCRSGALGCGECKMRLLASLRRDLDPIRERAAELRADPGRVLKVLDQGRTRAKELARTTMQEVHAALGLTSSRLPGGAAG